MKQFQKLFKKTSTGAIQEWEISVANIDNKGFISVNFGQVGGKIQETTEIISEGKNIGKSNETTAYEQAILEAESTWKSKLKKGYVLTIEDANEGKTNEIIEGGIFPMLAHKFSEQGHKIKYPALCQPKLDGSCCISDTYVNNCSLWSRTRKPINSVPHINKAIDEVIKQNNLDFKYLHGELYSHDYHNDFEELMHFIRQEEYLQGSEIIEYHVYDLPNTQLTNGERNKYLQSLKPYFENTPIKIVETIIVNNEDELMDAFDHFIKLGYEGSMVRNFDGKYVNKRSYDLQKVKMFDDNEFIIVNVKEGKGLMAGKAIFTCQLNDGSGNTFDVKMKGSLDELERIWNDPQSVMFKKLTVKYQGYTNKNNCPRFPVGVRIREEE